MKILHIVAGELTGGAAKGAYLLHKGLIKSGADSKVLTNSTIIPEDKNVVSVISNKKSRIENIIRGQIDNLPVLFYRKREKIIFSTGLVGFDFTKTKEYKEADIIHLHWINNGFVNVKHLKKVKKPIVWTIRDMWPMTGGCHYSLDCDNYKSGCGHCKQLKSKHRFDLSRIVLNRKKKYLPKNIKVVGISNWLSEQAKEGELFKDFDVRTISNNIDVREFLPINKKNARFILNINTKKKVVLAGANNINDFYKGFEKFKEAIKKLNKKNYLFCFFGKLDKDTKKVINELGIEYKSFGYLNDTISLRLVYSSADVFVAPSIQEAFGKTLAEAMTCGTPVVCFNATGPKDIVDHKENGYLARYKDVDDLAKGIEWVLNNDNYENLCKNAREKVVENFDSEIIAGEYKKLYEEVLRKC